MAENDQIPIMKMDVTILVENSVRGGHCLAEHGLSIYIELPGHNILFDTGASQLFARNASKIGLELYGAEFVFLSHGHHDHGGGLAKALREAARSKLVLHKNSTRNAYSMRNGKKRSIGLPDSALSAISSVESFDRVEWIEDDMDLSAAVRVLSGKEIPYREGAHGDYFCAIPEGGYGYDDFSHEIFLLVEGELSSALFVGCAHLGLSKIIEMASKKARKPLKHVFGGMHESSPDGPEIELVAAKILELGLQAHIGHCTGPLAFCELYRKVGRRLSPIPTSSEFQVDL